MRVAVVGAGIAGLAAAYGLRNRADCVVYEAELRLGGHAHTVDIDYDGIMIAVDTGFIVYNPLNYPNLIAFFEALNVPTKESSMSFSVSIGEGACEWAGDTDLRKVFAQPLNAFKPSFLWMLREIIRFNRQAVADLKSGFLSGLTLGNYLEVRAFSKRFRSDYLIPMGAAIWSTPTARMLDFPAESFVSFFDNHRLLSFDRPVWRTVDGGSRRYVEAVGHHLGERVRLGCRVMSLTREKTSVLVTDVHGHVERYDHVIVATHADTALAMMHDATPAERDILGAFSFADNEVWLHRDQSLMPKRQAAWAAWNYLAPGQASVATDAPVSVTYCMNLLQGIPRNRPLFISLNPAEPPRADLTFQRYTYSHPLMTSAALAGQRRLPSIQRQNCLSFAGAWSGHGFHEDGLTSGIQVAEALGGNYPWREQRFEREAAE